MLATLDRGCIDVTDTVVISCDQQRSHTKLLSTLRANGCAFLPGTALRDWLGAIGNTADWFQFSESWDRLGPDLHLASLGLKRRRRYACFSLASDTPPVLLPHRPHYQALEHNPLQGGLERWFDPVEPAIATSASLSSLLCLGAQVFGELAGERVAWSVEVHQFRIEASADADGQPTPEGAHRDGVDYVLAVLIQRNNIAQGTTTIHAPEGRQLGAFTLAKPLDAAFVDDGRVLHGVTPVRAVDPSRRAHRDVLVVTYKRAA